MAKKADFSKKILNSLSGKKALSVEELNTGTGTQKYAITRSLKNLADTGLIETLAAGQGEFARLTQKGRQKVTSLKLDSRESLANPNWDGKWRIILLDLPEDRKAERESLRYLLKKAGFIRLKNSAWVSPFPFEFLFQNLKKDFGLSTELMIIVTDSIDTETESTLAKIYNLKQE
jgi:DNA-binding transcriptional regulator PaaX